MRLYLLRHGAAADSEEWRGSDFDRPLTEKGRDRIAREAKALDALELGLDAIVTSPLVRARQTAAIVADVLGMRDRLVEDERLGPGFGIEPLAAILGARARSDALLLVGHEPSMSETVGALTGGARVVMKKGGVACVELHDRSSLQGELVWLAPPKLLAR
jgi:phosphohistidine phosphatase